MCTLKPAVGIVAIQRRRLAVPRPRSTARGQCSPTGTSTMMRGTSPDRDSTEALRSHSQDSPLQSPAEVWQNTSGTSWAHKNTGDRIPGTDGRSPWAVFSIRVAIL